MSESMRMMNRESPEERLSEMLAKVDGLAKTKGEKHRMRMQPALLNHETKYYDAMPGVAWTIELASLEDVLAIRESLNLFFEAAGLVGGGAVGMRDYMQDVIAALKKG